MTLLDSETAVYVLAAIGGLVVAAVAVFVVYGLFALVTIFAERACERLDKAVFYAFDGDANPDGSGRTPRPPWDRVWIELRYAASIVRWVQTKLGYANYVNPLERPNIERLYELREENWGDES